MGSWEGYPGHTEGRGLRHGGPHGGSALLILFVFTVKEAKSWEFEGVCWQEKESVRWDGDPARDVRLRAPAGPTLSVMTLVTVADMVGRVGLTRIRMKRK